MWELVLVSHSWCCEFSTPLAKAGAEFQTINNGCYLPRTNLFDCPHYECGSCFTDFFCDSHVPTFSIYHSKFKIYHVPSPLCHFTFVSIKWSRFNYLRQMVSVGPFTPYLLTYIYICMSICFHQIICVAGFCCPPLFRMARAACGAGASSPAFWYSKSFPFFIFFPRCFCFPCFLFCRGWSLQDRVPVQKK